MQPLTLNDIIYKPLEAEKQAETCALLIDIFTRDEYLTRESGLTPDEFAPLAEDFCNLTVNEGLSIIALHPETKRVVGFSIVEDPYAHNAIDPSKYHQITDKYRPFNDILEQLSHKFQTIKMNPGDCYHLFLLGVDPAHRGKKIGKNLVIASEVLAKELGFKYVQVEATSPLTQPICERLNYDNLGNLPYQHYTFNGEKPYQHITDFDGPYLFMKNITHSS